MRVHLVLFGPPRQRPGDFRQPEPLPASHAWASADPITSVAAGASRLSIRCRSSRTAEASGSAGKVAASCHRRCSINSVAGARPVVAELGAQGVDTLLRCPPVTVQQGLRDVVAQATSPLSLKMSSCCSMVPRPSR